MKKIILFILVVLFASCQKEQIQTNSFITANGVTNLVTGNDLTNAALIYELQTNDAQVYNFGIASNGVVLNFKYGATELTAGSSYEMRGFDVQNISIKNAYIKKDGEYYGLNTCNDYLQVQILENNNGVVTASFVGALSSDGEIVYFDGKFIEVSIN